MTLLILLLALTLSWQDNSDNENGFVVEKTVSGNCTDGFATFAYVNVDVQQHGAGGVTAAVCAEG